VSERWNTPARLRLTLALTVAGVVVFWAAATLVFLEGHATITGVANRGAPGAVDALEAHAALADCDRAAWFSFRSGQAELSGPGQTYQDDLTTAGQSLDHLASLGIGGSAGRQVLQAVTGQLVTYQGLVEQADATYREGLHPLAFAYLTYASKSLNDPGGLLARIDDLAALNAATLAADRRSGWVSPGRLPLIIVPAAVVLGWLVGSQVWIARRFRRALNPPLLLATLVVAALAGWYVAAALHADHAFARAQNTALPRAEGAWRGEIDRSASAAAASRAGQQRKIGLNDSDSAMSIAATLPDQHRLTATLADATDTGGLTAGLPTTAVALTLLTGWGFGLRLREYRP
jgi:hypothetical protein